jgi:hypothetical protein
MGNHRNDRDSAQDRSYYADHRSRDELMYGQSGANSGGMGQAPGSPGYGGELGRGTGVIGDRTGYHERTLGGPGYGTHGGGFGGGMVAGQPYGGGVASGRERVLDHRGKGPAGYQRSDERIRDEVCRVLTDDDQVDASDVEVTVAGGEVTLSGHVEDRRARHRAEDLVVELRGVKDVINQLRITSRT